MRQPHSCAFKLTLVHFPTACSFCGKLPALSLKSIPAILATLVLLWAGIPPATAHAQSEDPGLIFGHIVNGTTGEPVSEVTVTLSIFDVTLQPSSNTITDEDGRFEFPGVTTDPEAVYAVSTSFAGVAYSTGRISFEEGSEGIDITLDVYEPTDDQALITVYSRGLILTDVQPSQGEIGALDIYLFGMQEERVLVANEEGRTVEFPVPRNASRVTPLSDETYDLETATIEGATVFGTEPLLPGETTATLSYTIPYTGDRLPLELQAAYATDLFRLLIPTTISDLDEEVGLEASGFEFVGQEEIGPLTYNVWARENVAAGDRVQIAYTDIMRSEIEPNTLNKLIPMIIAAIAIIAAAVGIYWIVRERSLERERPVVLVPQLASTLEDRRADLIDQLQALETANERGLVDSDEYPGHRIYLLEQIRVVNRQLRGEGVED